ncbi:MAG: acyl-CoA dehydrogenase family protein [Candidatus Caldarchaeales archaeon]
MTAESPNPRESVEGVFSELWLSTGRNYFTEDRPLQLLLKHVGFKGDPNLERLGHYVSTEMMEASHWIDRFARPTLRKWSATGREVDAVQVSPEHLRTVYDLLGFGVVSKALGGERDLTYHFVSGYVISDAGFFCTITLTMQTACGLMKYGDGETRSRFLPNFLRRERPWTGATFYTEVQAGSDLGNIETVAEARGGRWLLRGLKYFASNVGLADAAIITAKPLPAVSGPRGVAAFFAPARKEDGSPNWRVIRLKEKLGTVTVPTGEVELRDAEAYQLGDQGQGIYVALEILTVARIDNAIAGLGLARKALWEAALYGSQRRAFGRRLVEHPLYLRDLVEMESRLQANLLLSLIAAKAFSEASAERPPYSQDYHRARLLSHVTKNMAAWASIELTRYAMELMGGIGFLEEFPMAKVHRDSLVTAIWEGTSNVQSLDMAEVLFRKGLAERLMEELAAGISSVEDGEARVALVALLEGEVKRAVAAAASDGVEHHSKHLLERLGSLIAALHYQRWAEETSKETGEDWPLAMSRVFLESWVRRRDIPSDLVRRASEGVSWMFGS